MKVRSAAVEVVLMTSMGGRRSTSTSTLACIRVDEMSSARLARAPVAPSSSLTIMRTCRPTLLHVRLEDMR